MSFLSSLTTLFTNNETYLSKHIEDINKSNAFPMRLIEMNCFISSTNNSSLLISGGNNEERSALLFAICKCVSAYENVVIIHNGNPLCNTERLNSYGMRSVDWDSNIYKGMAQDKILSLLMSDNEGMELSFFFAFALDVCSAMGKPRNFLEIRKINWLDTTWQYELLGTCDSDKASDLINRYDRTMAEKAVKSIHKLEKLTRTSGRTGSGIYEAFANNCIAVKEVYGSESETAKQCLEILLELAEKGERFTIILDNVYLDHSVITDNFRNVRLIISGDDIVKYKDDLKLTRHPCGVVIFNHSEISSCKAIARTFFGDYNHMTVEPTVGFSKTSFQKTTSSSVTVRRDRDLRLEWIKINNLSPGYALVRINDLEGIINIGEKR